jgi:hypothetical protein
MKINMTEHLNEETLISHIVLEGLANSLKGEGELEKFIKPHKMGKDYILDVKITVNDLELDLEHFVNHWQSQVERMIKEEAKELIEEKLYETEGLLSDLNQRIKSEIDKRLEDWEK